jgi:two-component system, OmpR family, response regulator
MKPFLVDDSAIRDARGASSSFQHPDWDTFAVDGLRIHFPSRTVHVDGRLITLSDTEYRLLCHLVRNAGRVLSCHTLLQHAWSSECPTTDVVRFQVSRLRAKLEAGWVTPRYIFAKPGVGYWFRGPADGPRREQITRENRRVVPFPTRDLDMLRSTRELLAAYQPIWTAA